MGSPGMLKRIPVIEPPKTPPQYTPPIRSSAGAISIRYVNGRTSTIAFSIVIPGRAPAVMPITSPTTIIRRFSGWRASPRPTARLAKASIRSSKGASTAALDAPPRTRLRRRSRRSNGGGSVGGSRPFADRLLENAEEPVEVHRELLEDADALGQRQVDDLH